MLVTDQILPSNGIIRFPAWEYLQGPKQLSQRETRNQSWNLELNIGKQQIKTARESGQVQLKLVVVVDQTGRSLVQDLFPILILENQSTRPSLVILVTIRWAWCPVPWLLDQWLTMNWKMELHNWQLKFQGMQDSSPVPELTRMHISRVLEETPGQRS